MRAWLMDGYEGVRKLRISEVSDPAPGPGEALLKLEYAALNPADAYLAQGQYPVRPRFPHILGRDGLGIVLKAPSGGPVTEGGRYAILRGDVGGERWGTFAQKVTVPVESLVEIPAGWSAQEAAGATLVYLTACQALTMWGPLPETAVVLVTGASGGVGVAGVQLAAAMGQTVIGLSRSPEKAAKIKGLGAMAVFDPGDKDWVKQAKAALGDRRVDLAIDNIGGTLLPEVIATLGDLGRVSLVGRLAGPVPQFNTATMFFRRLRMGGVAVGAYSNAEARTAWSESVRLLAKTGARPLVDSVFAFEDLPQAFERLARGPMGKVLLKI